MWAETVEVIRHSAKAVLVCYETVEAWIPYSQISDDSEVYQNEPQPGTSAVLAIPEWLAEEKGLML